MRRFILAGLFALLTSAATADDQFKYTGLPPEKAAAAMTVPEGFTVTLFAGEPDVRQPIAFCIDDRGRLWVVEAYSYPQRQPEGQGKDRILIFEDADGDGKFDKRTVFMEGLNLVSGIELGFGGVWIGAAPHFLFIPIDASGDKPAGPPQVLLDGWGYQDTHETLNTFTWGPDGWLYGCHGVFTHSRVGKPGTPDKDRTPINAGVWRYHPTRHVFEVFAHGTSNPWGLDFNEYGEMFVEACVIPHCYHIVPGGRYERQAGSHFNPFTYDDIKTIADHRHFVGDNPHQGNLTSDKIGGGHAHCGLMCYLGGAWPEEYRGQLFMGNIHGRRINVDALKPKGSGYVASHRPDFLLANDAWARFINFKYGPDGNVYMLDWYDAQACHDMTPQKWDRSNGRIYKISYRGTKPVTGVDLTKASDVELAKYQEHPNEWYARQSRRILQERAHASKVSDEARKALYRLFESDDERTVLRAMWTLNAVKAPRQLQAKHERYKHVAAWQVRLAVGEDDWETALKAAALGNVNKAGRYAAVVRRELASALQNWPRFSRSVRAQRDAAEMLVKTWARDGDDPNLSYLTWYAVEPALAHAPSGWLEMAWKANNPQLTRWMARRIASLNSTTGWDAMAAALRGLKDPTFELVVLNGINEGLRGVRPKDTPADWSQLLSRCLHGGDTGVREVALAVGMKFGDEGAKSILRERLSDAKLELTRRQAALRALDEARDGDLPPILLRLLDEPVLRADALKALAGKTDTATVGAILALYPKLTATEKRLAVATLAAEKAAAGALLGAIEMKAIPVTDVPADLVRQLRAHKDTKLDERLAKVWGQVRDTPADRRQAMDSLRKTLLDKNLPRPDPLFGRNVYAKTCQQCHLLYGVGGTVGPDITGSNRADLNYLIENVIDPSAIIPREYSVTKIVHVDGRLILGIVREETPTTLTVVTATETLTLAKADVESRTPSDVSMMPDDQLKPMSPHEIRSLFAYVQSTKQVPMLATAENAKDFFNGKDLTGWTGDMKLWRVENGEIVGKSPGIKRNSFLVSDVSASNFRLSLKVKLTPNAGNSGIQFRSEALANGEMKGYQADIGAGWWGKLYEESGRGLLSDKSGEQHVKPGDWNEYVIETDGSRVKTWINGQLCVDRDDTAAPRRGVFGLQIHSGGPMEVRFKELKLEVK